MKRKLIDWLLCTILFLGFFGWLIDWLILPSAPTDWVAAGGEGKIQPVYFNEQPDAHKMKPEHWVAAGGSN